MTQIWIDISIKVSIGTYNNFFFVGYKGVSFIKWKILGILGTYVGKSKY